MVMPLPRPPVLYANETGLHRYLFGYDVETEQQENDSDLKELYRRATRLYRPKIKMLVVYGGVHGYARTGRPTGQRPSEPRFSFMLGDMANKRLADINFMYRSLAKYTTNGSDVTIAKQDEIVTEIRGYLDNDCYVLLAWCFSRVWAIAHDI